MDWEPTDRDAWVADAQRWICQINGVRECKIDLDESGEIAGVHVVAGMEREPRHIVRDVEGLLKARLGMDVYYKKIGVVQMVDEGDGEAGADADTAEHADAAVASTEDAFAPYGRLIDAPVVFTQIDLRMHVIMRHSLAQASSPACAKISSLSASVSLW